MINHSSTTEMGVLEQVGKLNVLDSGYSRTNVGNLYFKVKVLAVINSRAGLR